MIQPKLSKRPLTNCLRSGRSESGLRTTPSAYGGWARQLALRSLAQQPVVCQQPANLIIICGPTGVGKSAYALRLARECGGAIVNADSQQVYCGCDIGTGKLAVAEREGIPHHCLDLVAPDQPFNAARYVTAADYAIADIVARGKRPIVVGGTGLYLQSLVYGLCAAPPADPAFRAAQQTLLAVEGPRALYDRLVAVDPEGAERIHPHHTSRVIRALEVVQCTGRSLFALHVAQRDRPPRYTAEWVGLTLPRAALCARIDRRVEAMLARGWVAEARLLLDRYGPDIPPLRAIGYRELVCHLNGEYDLLSATARIQQQTRRYAKRQMTWFRGMPVVRWSNPR